MRDLKFGDRVVCSEDAAYILSGPPEAITHERLSWANLKDWARWWLRQAELQESITLSREQRKVFQLILDGKVLSD